MNNKYKSYDLNPDTVVLKDCIITHENNNITRKYPILSSDNDPYYVLTPIMPKNSVLCFTKEKINSDGVKYHIHDFVFRGSKLKSSNTLDNSNNTLDSLNNDSLNNDFLNTQDSNNELWDNAKELFEKLNHFKRGMAKRMKYLAKIPEFTDKSMISLNLDTIRISGETKYRNIIGNRDPTTGEINGMNNFNHGIVKSVLSSCDFSMLLKILSFDITNKTVRLNIQLVRIFPVMSTLDNLPIGIKLHILKELNKKDNRFLQSYVNTNNIIVNGYKKRDKNIDIETNTNIVISHDINNDNINKDDINKDDINDDDINDDDINKNDNNDTEMSKYINHNVYIRTSSKKSVQNSIMNALMKKNKN